jgi:DNA-binding MarR family transcriptional regulator
MNPTAGVEETRGCLCLTARRNARAITRLYEERLRPYGLRATQFSILAALTLKGPTPVTDLADLLGLERTTLTRSAALLRHKGWSSIGKSQDNRERRLEITAAGRAKLEVALPAWKEAQAIAGDKIASGEWSLATASPN